MVWHHRQHKLNWDERSVGYISPHFFFDPAARVKTHLPICLPKDFQETQTDLICLR